MTQETEMPGEIWACVQKDGYHHWVDTYPVRGRSTPYIRRAVSKEEAGELAEYLDCGVACPPKIFDIIRRMTEAHK